jgi:L-rhamnono-1,4-lactonase
MPPAKKLDTHIHLWPATATTTKSHTWMTPGHFLAQRHGIDEYKTAISDKKAPPYGFIYVETDRALPSRFPDISNAATLEETQEKLRVWAAAPLEELKFLRRIVESAPTGDGSDGFQPADAGMMEGMVVYAPFHLPTVQFEVYLKMARATLGEAAWDKVVGYRYLLQGRGSEDVKMLVQSADFLRNLRADEVQGKVFDVGVDSHRDGVEVLHSTEQLVGKVEGVKFVLSMFSPFCCAFFRLRRTRVATVWRCRMYG